jgi:hypothetical protein
MLKIVCYAFRLYNECEVGCAPCGSADDASNAATDGGAHHFARLPTRRTELTSTGDASGAHTSIGAAVVREARPCRARASCGTPLPGTYAPPRTPPDLSWPRAGVPYARVAPVRAFPASAG